MLKLRQTVILSFDKKYEMDLNVEALPYSTETTKSSGFMAKFNTQNQKLVKRMPLGFCLLKMTKRTYSQQSIIAQKFATVAAQR